MVVVSTTAFQARVRGLVPGLSSLKETKMFLSHSLVKLSIVGSLHDREVACSASDLQGLNFESCLFWVFYHHIFDVVPILDQCWSPVVTPLIQHCV